MSRCRTYTVAEDLQPRTAVGVVRPLSQARPRSADGVADEDADAGEVVVGVGRTPAHARQWRRSE